MSKRTSRRAAPAGQVNLTTSDGLPPHSPEAERGVLGCILLAPWESLTFLAGKSALAGWFYDLRHQALFHVLAELHVEKKPIDTTTLTTRLADRKLTEAVGGLAYMAAHADTVGSAANLGYYLEDVHRLWRLRTAIQAATRLIGEAREGTADVDGLLGRMETTLSLAKEGITGDKPGGFDESLPIRDPAAILSYVPDPKMFLIGEGIIMRGDISVLAGFQGIGKSRLTRTLARAGMIGRERPWMGLPVMRQFRTCILQTEDNRVRLRSEFETLGDVQEWVRCSDPMVLDLHNPSWRAKLRNYFLSWPFDLLIIDNWTDVAGKMEVGDAGAVFQALYDIFRDGETRPHIMFLAHMRKPERGKKWTPKQPWELQHEISGTSALAGKARAMFAIQGTREAPDGELITFSVAKCSNEHRPETTAWLRANGEFKPVTGMDWEDYYAEPVTKQARRWLTEEMIEDALAERPLTRNALAKLLSDKHRGGKGLGSAVRWLAEDFADLLKNDGGLLSWQGETD